MPQKIFISYVDADKRYLNKIKRWGKRKKCGDIEIIFSTRDDKGMKTKRGRIIRPKLERKIKEADLVIVLVGGANDGHPWIRYEKFADEQKVVRYFMRIPYTEHPLPDALKNLTQIAYNPNAIEKLFRSENQIPATQTQSPKSEGDIAVEEDKASVKEESKAAADNPLSKETTTDTDITTIDDSANETSPKENQPEEPTDDTTT